MKKLWEIYPNHGDTIPDEIFYEYCDLSGEVEPTDIEREMRLRLADAKKAINKEALSIGIDWQLERYKGKWVTHSKEQSIEFRADRDLKRTGTALSKRIKSNITPLLDMNITIEQKILLMMLTREAEKQEKSSKELLLEVQSIKMKLNISDDVEEIE